MAHLYQHTEKEVHLLSGPSELQPVNDCITQYTPREKDRDLPQLSSTSEAQDTHREPATAVSQALIASCKLRVDQSQNDHQCQNGHYSKPKVYRRTRSMLKIRSTDVLQTRHNYSQLTEIEKAKFQTHSLIMMRETLSSAILSRKYQMILSTRQKILPLLLYFQN